MVYGLGQSLPIDLGEILLKYICNNLHMYVCKRACVGVYRHVYLTIDTKMKAYAFMQHYISYTTAASS